MDRRSFYHFIFFAFLLRHTLDQLKAASNKPVYQVRYGNWILMIIITIPTVVRAVAVHILCPPPEGGKIFVKCLQFSEKEGRNIEQLMTIKDGGVRKSTHLNDTICGLLGSTWWRVLWLGRPALHALTSTTCLVSTGQPSGWISFSFCSNRSP